MHYVVVAIDIPAVTYSVVTLPFKLYGVISTQVLQNDILICELFVPYPKC